MAHSTTLLARQPIYDTKMDVVAYELLFRAGEAMQADFDDGDAATSSVILNAFTEMPLEDILEDKPAFINFTRSLLDAPTFLNKEQLVVEVLEDITVDVGMLDKLKKLKSKGYTIALDDYEYDPKHDSLLELADIVKIDVMNLDEEQIADQVKQFEPFDIKLVAEKVETHEVFQHCKQLGFEMFQGFFLAKPQVVKGKKVDADHQNILRLLSVLQDSNVEFDAIDKVISTHAVLSYKLLRLINSAAFGLPREVESIRQAATMLGLEKIRNWASMLALCSLPAKPKALCLNTLMRGRMVQVLADLLPSSVGISGESMYTCAMVSTMDAFLDLPLPEVVNSLGLGEEIRDAILSFKGSRGLLLKTAIDFGQGDMDAIDWDALSDLGIDKAAVSDAYLEGLRWSADQIKQLW